MKTAKETLEKLLLFLVLYGLFKVDFLSDIPRFLDIVALALGIEAGVALSDLLVLCDWLCALGRFAMAIALIVLVVKALRALYAKDSGESVE